MPVFPTPAGPIELPDDPNDCQLIIWEKFDVTHDAVGFIVGYVGACAEKIRDPATLEKFIATMGGDDKFSEEDKEEIRIVVEAVRAGFECGKRALQPGEALPAWHGKHLMAIIVAARFDMIGPGDVGKIFHDIAHVAGKHSCGGAGKKHKDVAQGPQTFAATTLMN